MKASQPVLVSELAASSEHHPVSTLRDLKQRGYALGLTKTPSGQWSASLTKGDAAKYAAERELERTTVRRPA